MGAVMNLRPELFKAIIAQVPFVDVINTMLDETLPLTVIEWEEWGNPAIPEQYEWMRSYSPYDNVTATEYPAMLVTAGLNDPRVAYWEPAKWVAKLRAMKTDQNRLLFKCALEAGHGGVSGRYERLREQALTFKVTPAKGQKAFMVPMTGPPNSGRIMSLILLSWSKPLPTGSLRPTEPRCPAVPRIPAGWNRDPAGG